MLAGEGEEGDDDDGEKKKGDKARVCGSNREARLGKRQRGE